MIHEIVTCDQCNPQDRRKGITRLPFPNQGKGIFEGPPNAAKDAGWHIVGAAGDYCPDCLNDILKGKKRITYE